jgi:antitoxin component YwqK of YwqJK toxin-antitoxin module
MRIIIYLFLVLGLLFSCERAGLVIETNDTGLQLDNGILLYNESPFNGLLVARYANASIKSQLQYKEGRKDGYEKKWYSNGQLSQQRSYSKGFKVNNHLGWWPNGTPKFEYTFNGLGAYEGSRKEWYSNGALMLHFNYVDGKEIGNQKMWNDSGKIKANYDVVGGERFGLIGLKKCYTVNKESYALK